MSSTFPEMTEHFPIPSIRPIARRLWKIPIRGTKGEVRERYPNLGAIGLRDNEANYLESCAELEDLGFSVAHSVKSIRHYRVKYARKGQEQDLPSSEFSIWHHPAGVVLVVESGDLNRPQPCLESIKAYFQADLGEGSDFSIIGSTRIRSSGVTLRRMDGTNLKVGSVSFSPGRENLIDHFVDIQKHGRLVPLERWVDDPLIHIPEEFLFPILDVSTWSGRDIGSELAQNTEMAAPFLGEMRSALPQRLWQLIESCALPQKTTPVQETDADDKKEHRLREDWMAVEYSLIKISEGLFLTKQRFPAKEVREHVEHWMQVALGKQGEEISSWRADEPGPSGMSLATVLLYAISDPSHERLLRLIRERSVEEVKGWCTVPDAAGFVLGQRLIDRAFINTSSEKAEGLETQLFEVYEALAEKVGLENIKLITPLRSALGVWIENTAGQTDYALSSMGWRRKVASKLMLRMVSDGLDWNGPLNWRTYPNVVDSAQENRPKFLTMGPDPVSPHQWVALTGDNVRGVGLLSALMEVDMDRNIPPPLQANRSPRPKSRF